MTAAPGTLLQAAGLLPGEAPERWSITHPDVITSLHAAYLDAGSDIITANTFGINRDKFADYRELISAAIGCAKKAVTPAEKINLSPMIWDPAADF